MCVGVYAVQDDTVTVFSLISAGDHAELGEREFFLFNDGLNTFYLRLYGVRHMVKDHSDSEIEKPAAAT